MKCSEIQSQLKPLRDGELHSAEARSVRNHLESCAACRQEYQSIEKLHAMLRANDLILSDTHLQTGLNDCHTNQRLPLFHPGIRHTLTFGLAAAAVIVAAMLVLVPSTHPEKSLAAEVRDALAKTNTWHLSGWRQIGGKRVPWQIWGRRKPYLCYETVGSDSVYDDGTTQTRIYAPKPGNPNGLVVLTHSNGGSFSNPNEEPAWGYIVDPNSWQSGMSYGYLTKVESTDEIAVFRQQFPEGITQGVNANELFTIDKGSRLPVRYELKYDNNKDSWDTESMNATYDVNLPDIAEHPSTPPSYETVDMRTKQTEAAQEPSPTANLSIGLTIETKALAVTDDETILISANVFPSAGRLSLPPNGPFHFSVAPQRIVDVAGVDAKGTSSVQYLDDFSNESPPGNVVMLSPLEMHPPAGWTPQSVTVPLTTTVSIDVPSTDMLDVHGHPIQIGNSSTDITSETRNVRLSLVGSNISSTMVPYLATAFGPYSPTNTASLKVQIALAHTEYWWSVPDNPNLVANWPKRMMTLLVMKPHAPELIRFENTMQQRYKRARKKDWTTAADWLLIAADNSMQETPRPGYNPIDSEIDNLRRAGIYYREAGHEKQARSVWRRMLVDGKHDANASDELKEARMGLSGKRLAEDLDI